MALSGWPAQADDSGTKRDGTVLDKAFVDAIRASIEAALDGGAYLPNFDGLAVGYVAAAVADQIRLGDASFKLDFAQGGASIPGLQFAANDYIIYNRSTDTLSFVIGSTTELLLDASGLVVTDGLIVGYSGAPTADRIALGDANFYLDFGGATVPVLLFDATDSFQYTRATNTLVFKIGGATAFSLSASALSFTVSTTVTFTIGTTTLVVGTDSIVFTISGSEKGRFSTLGLFNSFKGADVASAAAIVPTGNVFHVTGANAITSITSTNIQAGTVITIIFDSTPTFTDGSNLKLAGNLVATADDTITLIYDGTNWYEIARSIN